MNPQEIVKCSRCRKIHLFADRVDILDKKKEWRTSSCPNCKGHAYEKPTETQIKNFICKMQELIISLINSGFVQRTTVLFQKANISVRFIDDRGIRISILLSDDMELTTFTTWENVDFSKMSAL